MTAAIDTAREMVAEADHQLAVELAEASAELLRDLRASGFDDADALRKAGDRRSHELLVSQLAVRRPADAVLSEEGTDDTARLGSRRVWIVDPLDGTREFGEPSRVDWAVHIALVVDGFPVVGAVALPGLGEVWSTLAPPGHMRPSRNRPTPTDAAAAAVEAGGVPGPEQHSTHSRSPRLAVSRTRPGWSAAVLTYALSATQVPLGSAGFKALAVVRGAADVYAHSGGQYEWDSAAPVAVALAHGVHASRLDGSPMLYNNSNPYLPDLLIAHPDWAQRVLTIIATAGPSTERYPRC